jgi:hypothetical protein
LHVAGIALDRLLQARQRRLTQDLDWLQRAHHVGLRRLRLGQQWREAAQQRGPAQKKRLHHRHA